MKLFRKDNVANILLVSFFMALFLKNYLGKDSSTLLLIMSAIMMGLGIASIIFLFYANKKYIYKKILLILIILIYSSFVAAIFRNNFRIEDFILVFVYWGIALLPFYFRLNYKVFKFLNYVLIVFFIYKIIQGALPENIFLVSRNFISVLLLITIGYHYVSAFQNSRNPSIILTALSLFVAIWASGRSGIIVFSFLLFSIYYLSNISLLKKLLLSSIVVVVSVLSFQYITETLFTTAIYRFEAQSYIDEGREGLNKEYFSAVFDNIFNLISGVNLDSLNGMKEMNLNPHNSFIRLHVYYGLFGFIIVVFLLINSIISFIKNKNYIYLVIFISLLIRSAVDSAAFHGPLDPLIFYFIFYGLTRNNASEAFPILR